MKSTRPLAITMWDFSWLERRWPGAGYEDWDVALGGLKERGYDAVRIDAYPHLVSVGPTREWELLPCWNCQDWGSPARTRVRVQPNLNEFLAACKRHGIVVALSSWFREEVDGHQRKVPSGEALGRMWVRTLKSIEEAGLLDTVVYLDLCNEWPLDVWSPFLYDLGKGYIDYASDRSKNFMRSAIAVVKERYPNLACTFSGFGLPDPAAAHDLSFLDFFDAHIWMAQRGGPDGAPTFNDRIGYKYPRWDLTGYEALQKYAEPMYRADPEYWSGLLVGAIEESAQRSAAMNLPLMTTECWAIVDYKDWPLLDWGWVKELCDLGVRTAAATGRWDAISTSNFCGPQFKGMWSDVAWHRRLTDVIHASAGPSAQGPANTR